MNNEPPENPDELIRETLEAFLGQFDPMDQHGELVLDTFFEMLLSGNSRDEQNPKA